MNNSAKSPRLVIINLLPESESNDSAVCTRNAKELIKYLSQYFAIDFASRREDLKNIKYDCVLFNYAAFYTDHSAFSQFLDFQGPECKIGWITNEYNLSPNSFFYKKINFVIANFDQEGCVVKVSPENFLKVNLNTLIYYRHVLVTEKKHTIIYYGTYRENRADYFKKYLHKPLLVSTSTKNQKKYKALGCTSDFTDKISWQRGRETLRMFKASLYIEDTETHTVYNHLANRFYEGLFCDCVLFFDKSCQGTIDKSGYRIDPYFIVNSKEEFIDKVGTMYAQKDLVEDFLEQNNRIAAIEKETSLAAIRDFLIEKLK